MLRIEPDTIREEIKQVTEILNKWTAKLADQGVYGEETPAAELNVEIFEVRLRGEIQLAAERLLALVEVLE